MRYFMINCGVELSVATLDLKKFILNTHFQPKTGTPTISTAENTTIPPHKRFVFLITLILALVTAPMTRQKLLSTINPSTTPAATMPLPATFTDNLPLPKLIVFDLDYTLWPLWCDTHISPPLKPNPKDAHRTIKDAYGSTYGFYPDVPALLNAIKDKGIQVGCASRTHTPDVAREMLRLLHLPPEAVDGSDTAGASAKHAMSAFDYFEAYPGSKTTHFKKIQKASGVAFEEMLFFDDEARNRNVEELGVVMQLVRDGVSRAEVDAGVERWRERNKGWLLKREKERAKEREG